MSELPKGWVEVEISKLGQIVTGKTPSTKNIDNFGGEVPFIKPGDLNEGGVIHKTMDTLTEKGLKLISSLPKNSIVVTCIGNLGKVGITKTVSATNQQINSVIPHEAVFPKYLYYQVSMLKPWLERESSATTVAIINKSKFSKAPITLAPLAEQKHIVEKLDQVLTQVDIIKARLGGIPAILKRFRQSVLAAAVSGKLTEGWRGENKLAQVSFNEIKLIKENLIKNKVAKKDLEAKEGRLLHSIPKEWLCVKLCSVALKITDGEHKTPKREGTGNYLLSARNVRDGYIALDNVDYVGDEEFSKLRKRCDPNKGDILISCSGSVGRVCLVDEDDKYVMVRSAALVRGIDEIIFNKFMMLALQSPMLDPVTDSV